MNPGLSGVAALLLQRGCPVERLEEAWEILRTWSLPATVSESVSHVDRAISLLNSDGVIGLPQRNKELS